MTKTKNIVISRPLDQPDYSRDVGGILCGDACKIVQMFDELAAQIVPLLERWQPLTHPVGPALDKLYEARDEAVQFIVGMVLLRSVNYMAWPPTWEPPSAAATHPE